MAKRRRSAPDPSPSDTHDASTPPRDAAAPRRARDGRKAAKAQPKPHAEPKGAGGPRKPGRPSGYSDAIAAEIIRRLSEGEALIAICRDEHMPAESTVRGWVTDDHEGFAARYARARDLGLERMAEETVEIADDSGLDVVMTDDGPKPNGEVVQRAKLRVDTRKWLLSKLAPKRYGERLQVEATVSVSSMDDAELVSELRRLAERLGVTLPASLAVQAEGETS